MCIIIFSLIYLINSVSRTKFKTCEQSGFCKRSFSEKLVENRFLFSHFNCEKGAISANLIDQYFNTTLLFSATALEDNRIRILAKELNPKFERFDVFEHAWKNMQKPPITNTKIETKKLNSTACELALSADSRVFVNLNPLLIEIFKNNEKILSFNNKNAFYIEPQILTFGANGEREPIAHESFDGHTDSLPHGYQAVSFDTTFHNFNHVYGIPEHADTFPLNDQDSMYRLFNLDVFEYELYNQMALYGSAPFMVAKNEALALGLLFLNAAEMWININKNMNKVLNFFNLNKKTPHDINTRWVAESGILDVIIMLGPSPRDVSYQYALTTGFPNFPSLFSIAYHQCRWNYNDQDDILNVNAEFNRLKIPYDVIWLDIEHTPDRKYFRWNHKFPSSIDMIHNISYHGRKLVTVVDPHVKAESGYNIYDHAIKNSFEVKDKNNNTYTGWCWPGNSIYLNIMNPEVRSWYSTLFDTENYKGTNTNVHTWVDMNEPSVFNGPEVTVPKDTLFGQWENRDIHNIYSFMTIDAVFNGGLVRSKNKLRPFVLSRSFFPGSQKYGAVWTGDNLASWDHLKITIPMLLSLSIAGIPFVGADVSGFFQDPEPELFIRWYQAASMQPFFRGHSHIETKRREPWSYGSPTTESVDFQIKRRYRYLLFFYYLFFESHKLGIPIMRPLWYEFPHDVRTFEIQDSYLLGSSILVKPIVDKGVNHIDIYFPLNKDEPDKWLSLFNFNFYQSGFEYKIRMDSVNDLPIFQKTGTIVPTWERYRRSSDKMFSDPVTLTVVLDDKNHATGSVYLDDFETFDYNKGHHSIVSFDFSQNTLNCGVIGSYRSEIWLEKVIIYGLNTKYNSASVTSQGKVFQLAVFERTPSIIIKKPGIKLTDGFVLRLN